MMSGSETHLMSLGHDFLSSSIADDCLTNLMDSACPPDWTRGEGSATNLSLVSDVFEEPDDVVKKKEVKVEVMEKEEKENKCEVGEKRVKMKDKGVWRGRKLYISKGRRRKKNIDVAGTQNILIQP